MHPSRFLPLFPLALSIIASTPARTADEDRSALVKLIAQVQKADYEGDRATLHHLVGALAPFANNKEFASRVHYWRGFAFWRSAINGFNDNTDKNELQLDLNSAVEAFDKSQAADANFVDSKIAMASCLGTLAYVLESDSPKQQEDVARSRQKLKEAMAAAPNNPRLLWVLGPIYWNLPADRGGGQDKAIEGYKKGLEIIRGGKNTAVGPIDPTWGEPELFMALAWSYLNRATPDIEAAEQNAASALQLVPNWHYVRDILMRQIRDAKTKQSAKTSPNPSRGTL